VRSPRWVITLAASMAALLTLVMCGFLPFVTAEKGTGLVALAIGFGASIAIFFISRPIFRWIDEGQRKPRRPLTPEEAEDLDRAIADYTMFMAGIAANSWYHRRRH
jgi:hypothetical protein